MPNFEYYPREIVKSCSIPGEQHGQACESGRTEMREGPVRRRHPSVPICPYRLALPCFPRSTIPIRHFRFKKPKEGWNSTLTDFFREDLRTSVLSLRVIILRSASPNFVETHTFSSNLYQNQCGYLIREDPRVYLVGGSH